MLRRRIPSIRALPIICATEAPTWPPGDARLALAVMVSLEHYELQPPADAFQPVNLPGGMGRAPYPDVRAHSQRAYGNRVGVFRIMRALAQHGIKATAAVDVWTARNCPALVASLVEHGWEIAGHGHAVPPRSTREDGPRQTQRKYILAPRCVRSRTCSVARPAGWHGPEYGESTRTPALLAELGVKYVMDWPNDEQPYRMDPPTAAR